MISPRVIEAGDMALSLGMGSSNDETHIRWRLGTCVVDGSMLRTGTWILFRIEGPPPPAEVVCLATALALSAWIKSEMREATARITERMP